MKNTIKLLLLLTTMTSFSQIEFEKGYYITNDGTKIDCLIRNVAWEYNPNEFDYKLNETDNYKVAKISDVKEFNVANAYKFVRYTTNVNISKLDMERVDLFKDPKLEVKTIFLKVIDQGNATLYEYVANNKRTYYFSTEPHEKAELLVFKEYNYDESTLKENNFYKQQLSTILVSEKLNQTDFVELQYTKDKLSKLFAKYNDNKKTQGNENFSKRHNQSSINLKVLAGVNFVSIDFLTVGSLHTEINFKPIFAIGFEAEYILPFNQKKWSFFISPNYQSFSFDKILNYPNYYLQTETGNIDLATQGNYQYPLSIAYSKIEIPIGFRHFLFLNKKSKLFLNAGVILNISSSSEIKYNHTINYSSEYGSIFKTPNKSKFSSDSGVFAGFGYTYNKFAFELRYNLKTQPPVSDQNAYIGISSFGLLTSYKLL